MVLNGKDSLKRKESPSIEYESIRRRTTRPSSKNTVKRASLPVVITNGFSASTESGIFRKKVNEVDIDGVVEKRKSCPNKTLKTPSTNIRSAASSESLLTIKSDYKKNDINSQKVHDKKMLGEYTSVMKPPTKQLPPPPTGNYSYVSREFRPMILTDDCAISAPVEHTPKTNTSNPGGTCSYTKVNLKPKPNDINIVSSPNDSRVPQHTVVNDDLYAVVDKNNIANKPDTDKQYYDAVKTKTPNTDITDLYAAINYSSKRRISAEDVLSQPPPLLSHLRIRDVRRVSEGILNIHSTNFNKKRQPPAIPTPYAERKWDLPTHDEEPWAISDSTRQRLDSFSRNSISTEDMFGSFEEKKPTFRYEMTDLLSNSEETLAKSQNAAELKNMREFKKQHRRMRSHEPVDKTFFQDLVRGNSSSSLSNSKESEEDTFSDSPSVDMTDYISKNNELNTNELPEGWQEVNDGSETYYWHIWTGTIQYERPAQSTTPSTSSDQSRPSSVSDPIEEKNSRNVTSASPRPETPDKLRQIISFHVHSMGWMDVDEALMGGKIIADTVNNCISTLAEKRHDLWNTMETWAEGADIKLILEGETLKLYELKTKAVLHVQPIAKMRVWGVGRAESRDFAYIARDQSTGKHRCHMFRCHGHVSGRSITNALQAICNRVLDEKRKQKEKTEMTPARVSDLLKPPVRASPTFNEKPYVEQKKCFTAKYVGSVDVSKSSGIDVINKSVGRFTDQKSTDWSSVLVEVSTSEIKTIDCMKQQVIMEHRVRFISFLGVAQDERFGAYIVAVSKDAFRCHVFFCAPHAGTLTKAVEEACKLRFEKMLDGKIHSKNQANGHSPPPQKSQQLAVVPSTSVKEKTSKFLSASFAGVLNKLNKKDIKKKDDDINGTLTLCANEHLVKYFGSVDVDIGTGVETVQTAVNGLVGGEMMIGYLEIKTDCITLLDSQRTALSKRIYDLNTISYCGMTSDRKHFGIIVSRGKGKYTCHVFQEYKPNLGEIVHAIHEVL